MKKGLLLIALFAIFTFNFSNAQILSEDFEGTPGELPTGWLTVTPTYPTAATNWHPNDYNENDCFRASSYFNDSNHETEQWLVTPSFSTEGLSTLSLVFDNEKASYPGNALQVFISTNFPGDSASHATSTWDEITGLNLSTGVYEWVTSTSDISSYVGNASVYIAFKYTSTASEGAVWDVDNVVVSGTSGIENLSKNTRIFPNPATSVLNIKSISKINNITVSNVIGQRIINISNVDSKNFSLEVESLANGVYLINIENIDGISSITKFVKE